MRAPPSPRHLRTGSLTKATAGSLTLSGANIYSGGTTLSLGTLIAGSDSALGTGTLTISGAATLQASGTRSLSNDVAVGSNFTHKRHWALLPWVEP